MIYLSKQARAQVTFLRPSFISTPEWNIPVIERQELLSYDNLQLIAFSDTSKNPSSTALQKGVHFFIDDYRFERVYNNPDRYLARFQKFPFVLTPDFSLYADLPRWRQLESVAKNRWCGAYWQSHGITVIPTISWGFPDTYEFCFDGVSTGSTIAVSTVGCCRAKDAFLRGYEKMLDVLNPKHIICFGKPFSEMNGTIHYVSYSESRRGNR